jgi:hypothetical protein
MVARRMITRMCCAYICVCISGTVGARTWSCVRSACAPATLPVLHVRDSACVRAAWLRCALPRRNAAAAAAAAAGGSYGTAGAAAAAAAACQSRYGIARTRSLGRLSLGLLQLRSVWPDQAVVSTRENYEAWLSYWTGRLCHSERSLCQAFGSDRAFSEVSLLRDNAGFNSTSGRLPGVGSELHTAGQSDPIGQSRRRAFHER